MEDRFITRYYDKDTRCIYSVKPITNTCENGEDITFYGILVSGEGQISEYNLNEIYKNRFVKMQCTGLKDKNSKSIFEGDILKQPDGIIDYVYWDNGCYIHNGTAITNYDICYQGDTWAKEVNTHEVIGNIYENKELLEEE